VAVEAGVKMVAVESGKTLLLDAEAVKTAADQLQITIYGIGE
jgi:DUF1009 family protein